MAQLEVVVALAPKSDDGNLQRAGTPVCRAAGDDRDTVSVPEADTLVAAAVPLLGTTFTIHDLVAAIIDEIHCLLLQ